MQGNGSFQTKINPSNVDDYFQFLEEIWIFEISSKNTLLTLTTQFYSSYLEILLFPLRLFSSFFFFNYWFYFMFILFLASCFFSKACFHSVMPQHCHCWADGAKFWVGAGVELYRVGWHGHWPVLWLLEVLDCFISRGL